MELKYILVIFCFMILLCYTSFNPKIEFFAPTCSSTRTGQKLKNKQLDKVHSQIGKQLASSRCEAHLMSANSKGSKGTSIHTDHSTKDGHTEKYNRDTQHITQKKQQTKRDTLERLRHK